MITAVILYRLGNFYQDAFAAFYGHNMRSALFTAFLTLSGFLLSAKTFVIANMKKDLYDSKEYRSKLASLRELNSTLSNYGPLKRLSYLLSASIGWSLLTSFSQFSIGLTPHWIAAVVCLWLAATAFILLFISLWVVSCNLSDWFTCIEEAANGKCSDPKDDKQ